MKSPFEGKELQLIYHPTVSREKGESSTQGGAKAFVGWISSGWWFPILFIFTPIWGRFEKFDRDFSAGLVGLKPPTRYLIIPGVVLFFGYFPNTANTSSPKLTDLLLELRFWDALRKPPTDDPARVGKCR